MRHFQLRFWQRLRRNAVRCFTVLHRRQLPEEPHLSNVFRRANVRVDVSVVVVFNRQTLRRTERDARVDVPPDVNCEPGTWLNFFLKMGQPGSVTGWLYYFSILGYFYQSKLAR